MKKHVETFLNSNNVREFIAKLEAEGVKENSAKVYWYTLSKQLNRKVEEKRGRKPTKPNYKEGYYKLLNKVKEEEEKAKKAKKSTAPFKNILEVVM